MAAKLWRGSTVDSVRDLQRKLNENGYKLDEDVVFGNNTYSAVVDYQRRNNLAVDGVVGEVTVNTAITDALGAMYMVVTDYFSWPDALFSAPQRIVQAAPITTAPLFPIIRGGDTTKDKFRMYLLYSDIYENTINWVIGVEAKARWK